MLTPTALGSAAIHGANCLPRRSVDGAAAALQHGAGCRRSRSARDVQRHAKELRTERLNLARRLVGQTSGWPPRDARAVGRTHASEAGTKISKRMPVRGRVVVSGERHRRPGERHRRPCQLCRNDGEASPLQPAENGAHQPRATASGFTMTRVLSSEMSTSVLPKSQCATA